MRQAAIMLAGGFQISGASVPVLSYYCSPAGIESGMSPSCGFISSRWAMILPETPYLGSKFIFERSSLFPEGRAATLKVATAFYSGKAPVGRVSIVYDRVSSPHATTSSWTR